MRLAVKARGPAAIVVACAALALGGVLVTGGASATMRPDVTVGGAWGSARQVSGLAAGGVTDAQPNVVSCASTGNCVVGGYYHDASGAAQAFLLSEVNGTWGQAQEVPGSGAINPGRFAEVEAISCPAPGYCQAAGVNSDLNGDVAYYNVFVVAEKAGAWGQASGLPGMVTLNAGRGAGGVSLSCPSVGSCVIGGYYSALYGAGEAFVAEESGGTWGTAHEVPGTDAVNTQGLAAVNSVSCSSPGNCTAGGYYGSAPGQGQPFVARETGGTWGNAQPVPGTAPAAPNEYGEVRSLSCRSSGNCTAGGSYSDGPGRRQAFVADESAGSWGTAQPVPGVAALNVGHDAVVSSLSCSSPGNCAAVGIYKAAAGYAIFIASEVQGTWGTAQPVPGTADGFSASVSCPAPGTCSAGGGLSTGADQGSAFVADQASGTWGTPAPLAGASGPSAAIDSLSCPAPGNCAATGYYVNSSGQSIPFVAERAWTQPTTTALTLSAAKVTYGDEQAQHLTVTVTPAIGGKVTGTVAVTAGSASVCTITLSGGKGSCTLAAMRFPAGAVTLKAAYSGARGLAASSASKGFTVARASSKASLTLSVPKVQYGHETSERFRVTVTPQYAGTPSGTVKVTAGATTVCTITLNKGSGSCVLAAARLTAGTYSVQAHYAGNASFTASTSAARTLTVTK
jgi:hypothetical protein